MCAPLTKVGRTARQNCVNRVNPPGVVELTQCSDRHASPPPVNPQGVLPPAVSAWGTMSYSDASKSWRRECVLLGGVRLGTTGGEWHSI